MSLSNSIRLLINIVIILSRCYEGETSKKVNTRQPALSLTIQDLQNAIDYGNKEIDMISNVENHLSNYNVNVKIGSPSHGQLINSQPSIQSRLESRNIEILDKASKYIILKHCPRFINSETKCAKMLSEVKLDHTSLGSLCLSKYYNDTKCQGLNLKYRSADGSCNNLKHSFWGKSNTQYKRLLFPAYKDGINSYQSSSTPNARELSNRFVSNKRLPETTKTIAMAFWTIFIGHDLSHTAVSNMLSQNHSIECCSYDGLELSTWYKHPLCASIIIPKNDKFFSPQGRTCMNYVRSTPAMRSDCTFGPREQLNQATHYLDASTVYGSSEDQTLSLRTKSRGRLSSYTSDRNLEYMPAVNSLDACASSTGECYIAGDVRANARPHLTTLHTLWLREHNRIADKLAEINPHWDDERTFQETRRIIVAFVQHITYAEWLPELIGEKNIDLHQLGTSRTGYSALYNDDIDPSVSNSFATSILPFANSMFKDTINLYAEDRTIEEQLSLKEYYNRPIYLQKNYMDQLVRGLSIQNAEEVDLKFTRTLTNYLYSDGNTFGMDIVSLGIQRGRDHGIPSYTQFRRYCKLYGVDSYKDLHNIMVEGAVPKLLNYYKSVDDIELMVGALLEVHEAKSMVGPTMRCIIAEQFKRTMRADKYFYDLPDVFQKNQLAEIRKMTLARLFCDNSDSVTKMQKNVFLTPKYADLNLCNSSLIQNVDLNYWKEEQKNILKTTTQKSKLVQFYPTYFFNGVG